MRTTILTESLLLVAIGFMFAVIGGMVSDAIDIKILFSLSQISMGIFAFEGVITRLINGKVWK